MRLRLFCCLLAACVSSQVLAQNVTQFRGHLGSGVFSSVSQLPVEWSAETGEGLRWKVDLPGSGWSQPVIWGDRIFVTSAVANEDLKPKNFADGVKTPQSMGLGFMSSPPDVNIKWTVFCIDARTGQQLWSQVVKEGKPQHPVHPSNSYATETPALTENAVFAYFGATGTISGLSHAGEKLWTREFGAHKTSNSFGTGSSLATYGGNVYLQDFSQESSDLYCLSGATGETVWKASRPKNDTSWSSPILWENSLQAELIVSGGSQVDSFDPSTGKVNWTLKNVKAATACSVAADSSHIYFGGSDPFSSGPLFAVTPGGSGDISPKKNNGEFAQLAWLAKSSAPGMASPVSDGKQVYVADKNILRCYDVASGERIYQNRLPGLGMVNASPLIAGNAILLVDEAGKSIMVRTGPEMEVVAKGDVSDTVWATPAVTNDAIYIRGVNALYCIDIPQ